MASPLASTLSSATSRFVNNTVILQCLAEHVEKNELINLCLVCKMWNAEFTRSLYRDISTSTSCHEENIKQLEQLLYSAKHLHRVRSLFVDYWGAGEELSDMVADLLGLMPNLESFASHRGFIESTIKELSQITAPLIKKLRIIYNEEEWFMPAEVNPNAPCKLLDFTGFANLEKLTLLKMNSELGDWRYHIGTLLINSPSLKKLKLSIDYKRFHRQIPDGELHQALVPFFDTLAEDYAASGGPPLPLQSLWCGSGIIPQNERCLRNLVNLSQLKKLFIANKGRTWRDREVSYYYPPNQDSCGIPFRVFLTDCPNLRSFRICKLEEDVWQALLLMGHEFSRQLYMSCRNHVGAAHSMNELIQPDAENHPNLPMPTEDDACGDSLEGLSVTFSGQDLNHGLMGKALADGLVYLPQLTRIVVRFPHDGIREPFVQEWAKDFAMAAPRLKYVNVHYCY